MKLAIWDTQGDPAAIQMTRNFYKGSHAVVVIYAINSPSSYKSVSDYLEAADQECGNSTIKVIVGNKCDLNSDRRIKAAQLADKAEEHDVNLFFETSALPEYKGTIDTLFNSIIEKLADMPSDSRRS